MFRSIYSAFKQPIFLSIAICIFIFIIDSRCVYAQTMLNSESQCQSLEEASQAASDPVLTTVDGIIGMFFPMPKARLVLCELRELSLRRSLVQFQIRENQLWQLQIDNVEQQLDLANNVTDEYKSALEKSEESRREAIEMNNAWYRNPLFISGISIILTAVVIVGGGYLVNELLE